MEVVEIVSEGVPLSEVNALSLFELYFDEGAMDRILRCTNAYAEHKKEEKKKRYALFMKRKLTKDELKAFIGALLLLGIHGVRNHRKAWSSSKAQYLARIHDLMTCQRFELIGCFLHVVTPEVEEQMGANRLWKLIGHLWKTSKPTAATTTSPYNSYPLTNEWSRVSVVHI